MRRDHKPKRLRTCRSAMSRARSRKGERSSRRINFLSISPRSSISTDLRLNINEMKMKESENSSPINERSLQSKPLTDLPVAEKQAEETRGGKANRDEIEILSYSWGLAQTGTR